MISTAALGVVGLYAAWPEARDAWRALRPQ
jgi:hypothetical protein